MLIDLFILCDLLENCRRGFSECSALINFTFKSIFLCSSVVFPPPVRLGEYSGEMNHGLYVLAVDVGVTVILFFFSSFVFRCVLLYGLCNLMIDLLGGELLLMLVDC